MNTVRFINRFRALVAGLAVVGGLAMVPSFANADPVGGNVAHIDTVVDHDVYRPILLSGGEVTQIRVTANAAVELLVYNEDGDLVSDKVGTICVTNIAPSQTALYTIKVVNLDDTPTTYVLRAF